MEEGRGPIKRFYGYGGVSPYQLGGLIRASIIRFKNDIKIKLPASGRRRRRSSLLTWLRCRISPLTPFVLAMSLLGTIEARSIKIPLRKMLRCRTSDLRISQMMIFPFSGRWDERRIIHTDFNAY